MHSAIESMLEPYQCETAEDYVNALKAVVQEIALLGLYRGDFFRHAAFYGGTALRIFYGLDRFSEDLDFSLLQPDTDFDLSRYFYFLREELNSYGLEMTVEERTKSHETPIQSAFIKGGTRIHLLKLEAISPPVSGVHPNQLIKIKLEVDTDPPAGGDVETKYQLNPIPYNVRIFTLPTLFAGKLHALIARSWKSRVKGRDYYDYLWYLSKGVEVDIGHLRNRMIQSGHLEVDAPWDENVLQSRLADRFAAVDFTAAGEDVRPYIADASSLDLWSEEFFLSVTRDRLRVAEL